MFSHHCEMDDLYAAIESIKVDLTTHASGNTHRAFHVKRWCDFDHCFRPSYLKCFQPNVPTQRSRVTSAMRDAIQLQVDECRRKACSKEPGHVHHDPPFSALRDEWVFCANGYDRIEITYCERYKTWQMANPDQKRSWQEHHRRNCKLVFLTPEEHSKLHYNK